MLIVWSGIFLFSYCFAGLESAPTAEDLLGKSAIGGSDRFRRFKRVVFEPTNPVPMTVSSALYFHCTKKADAISSRYKPCK